MYSTFVRRVRRSSRGLAPLLACAALLAGCGGGSGGTGSGDTLPDLVLVGFVQSGQDNVPLNRTLEFRFSSPIDPASVVPGAIQVREGPEFGQSVDGNYVVQGDRVYFEPRLPGRCDLSDSGLQPGTEYRVTLIGSPEEFAVRSLAGAPLQATITASFSTRPDTDPELFEDQVPGVLPTVESTDPADGASQVGIAPSNRVEIVFSENLNPCTVDETTVTLHQHATGDVANGFVPPFDAAPSDKFSWGSGTPTLPPRRINCTYVLTQSLLRTTLTLTPAFGEFPDNSLLVCQVTNQVRDFGGNPLVPLTFAFTTQNRPAQTKARVFEFDGDVPIVTADTTGEVNTARSPSRAQGWVLVAGDGDNGSFLLQPSGPGTQQGPGGCVAPFFQPNDSVQDDFDPLLDVLLSTGATPNTCRNAVDGSTAVVFEYRTFRVRNGVTVRMTGVNPAIILVRGEVLIEAGGRLLARGDGTGGSPNPNGANGLGAQENVKPAGGTGAAGGGDGGDSNNSATLAVIYGGNGAPGYGSPDFGAAPGFGGVADPVLVGPGRGAVGNNTNNSPPPNRFCVGGGGGGHGKAGGAGQANGNGSTPFALMDAFVDGAAGGTYGDASGSMPTPEAGSGGGAGGTHLAEPWSTGTTNGSGGAGGAGGGFVDITSSATIRVFGAIDANGGRGGNGGASNNFGGFFGGGGGGGGGAGGGIRLLTPGEIVLATGASLTAAGGLPGTSPVYAATPQTLPNLGGAGGVGRLVLEDADGVIQGLGGATVTPGEAFNTGGDKVFFRGTFDGARFQGGGLRPVVVTEVMDMGPFSPDYVVPDQDYGAAPGATPPEPRMDFAAGVPSVSSRGISRAAMFIEVQGFPANADGTVNLALPSGWKSVGTFLDSGSEPFPQWVPNAKPGPLDVPPADLPPGNTGDGIDQIDGRQFLQFRITFFLGTGAGPFDPGPYLDRWALWLTYDQ